MYQILSSQVSLSGDTFPFSPGKAKGANSNFVFNKGYISQDTDIVLLTERRFGNRSENGLVFIKPGIQASIPELDKK